MSSDKISRRSFVSSLSASAFAFTIVPRHVLGGPGYVPPSDRVSFALIGAGGRGMQVAQEAVVGDQNLAALVDVDFGFVDRQIANRDRNADGSANADGAKLKTAYGRAKRYVDFREMLERERNNIDGVVVATPDHTHATIALAAMQMGKAAYVEKPLTWSVQEARTLAATAKRTGVVTQMGNQGHSGDGTRRINEIVRSGVIGPVSEVLVWTNRPIWPQGVPRPTTGALRSITANPNVSATAQQAAATTQAQLTWENVRNLQPAIAAAMAQGSHAVPAGLNWELFIGPAPMIPYHPIYHPFNWRGWVDWGVGALGDMGAHLVDQPVWALDLGYPTSVEATSSPFGMDVDETPATWPQSTRVHYEFAARGSQPAVTMRWFDGGLMPERPKFLPDDVTLERGGGGIFVGTKGILVYSTYGENPRLYPQSLQAEADRVRQTEDRVPRGIQGHVVNWANAVMERAPASSEFEYAAKLTEIMLLGMVALRTGQGRKILYDGAAGRITNIPEANQLLHREYRSGWSL